VVNAYAGIWSLKTSTGRVTAGHVRGLGVRRLAAPCRGALELLTRPSTISGAPGAECGRAGFVMTAVTRALGSVM
jgi:hypothetical protein